MTSILRAPGAAEAALLQQSVLKEEEESGAVKEVLAAEVVGEEESLESLVMGVSLKREGERVSGVAEIVGASTSGSCWR